MDIEFSTKEIIPNPSNAFIFHLVPIKDIIKESVFILDANVLLLPFTTDDKSLNSIKKVYRDLSKQKRLFIPAQAVREFLINRPKKITDIYNTLLKKRDQNFQYIGNHPLLAELEEYKTVREQENNVRKAIIDYRSEIINTLKAIQSWGWNDPVSKMYQEVLVDCVLSDRELDIEEIKKDLERRNQHNIPPGYKDNRKNYNQEGDLLIWHEILLLGSQRKQHIIFISGDKKADWWHNSGNENLYPRFELVNEFQEKSGGKSFHIISLSNLLELFDTEKEVIDAVKISEKQNQKIDTDFLLQNVEIAEKALKIVIELRKIQHEQNLLTNKRMSEIRKAVGEQQNRIWEKFNKFDQELIMQYESCFKIDVIILRDKMIERLPNDILENIPQSSSITYEHPVNIFGIIEIADNLEYLAKSLLQTYKT